MTVNTSEKLSNDYSLSEIKKRKFDLLVGAGDRCISREKYYMAIIWYKKSGELYE